MKGPGAIILIGAAVFLIVIGATDKVQDVWNAIRGVTGGGGGNSPDTSGTVPDLTDTQPPNKPPSNPNCVGEGEMKVTPQSGEVSYCCPKTEVGTTNDDGTCPQGYTPVTYQAMPTTKPQSGCTRLAKCHIQGSGAGFGRMNISLLPTGLTGYRHAPNI